MNQPKDNKATFWLIITALVFAGLAVVMFYYTRHEDKPPPSYSHPTEPSLAKEGTLYFLDSTETDTISSIVIEIADNDYDRAKGLMYRYSMPDSVGMLLIFEEEELQSFWMRNTYFSLDIIYVSSGFEIVNTQKYTQPFSTVLVRSEAPSMYVVEVNAGYCDNNKIRAGNRIVFTVDTKKTP